MQKASEALLKVEDLSVEYRTNSGVARALRGVSLEIAKGETVGVVGESGSGKSTLGMSILGLLPPAGKVTGGRIALADSELFPSRSSLEDVRGSRIAMVFQDPLTSLNPVKKVGDHFVEYIRAHEKGVSREEALSRTVEVLEDLGISAERVDDYPHQFSGGMRQRVMIGLALILKPQLIIADEPTTALDVIVEAQILSLMKDLKDKYSLSLILITHNIGIVAEMADRIAVMYGGRIVEIAPALQLFESPHHPYTQALLQSIPTVESSRKELKVIPGFPPDLTALPEGCPYNPRCPFAFERCFVEDPPLTPWGPESAAACHLLTQPEGKS